MTDGSLEEWISKATRIYADLRRLSERTGRTMTELLQDSDLKKDVPASSAPSDQPAPSEEAA
jgi:hypothetical protein